MTASLEEALAYIHSFKNYELTAPDTIPEGAWDLSRIEAFLDRLGNPQNAYPIIHIAGSKGKGSTAAFCTQALMQAGLRTGLYVSPHLIDFRERIQINRLPISTEALVTLVEDVKPTAEQVPDLTWFELLTALAFWHFAREGVDAAVIEVGLGGRLDATNVVTPIVSVITRLALDHTQLLGDTLPEIAAEKAAIIKPGVPVVTGPQAEEAMRVVEETAARQGSPLIRALHDTVRYDDPNVWTFQPTYNGEYGLLLRHRDAHWSYTSGLPGLFQAENAAIATAALHEARAAGLKVTDGHIERGLASTRWRGRFEFLNPEPLLIVDSAHNPESARTLARELRWLCDGPRWTLVFGCMADKDVAGMLEALLPLTARAFLAQADHPRAMAVEPLAEQAHAVAPALSVTKANSVAEVLERALHSAGKQGRICVAGSLAVAGEAIAAWESLKSAPPN